MASLQLLYTADGNQAKLDARNEFKSRQREGGKLVVQQAVAIYPLLPLLRAHARASACAPWDPYQFLCLAFKSLQLWSAAVVG